jgi:streptomycin 6-kinase
MMREIHGDDGFDWLKRLPSIIANCAERWSLTIMPPFTLSYNYVCPAIRSDGTDVILKIGYPDKELFTEIESLKIFNSDGIAKLLDSDDDNGALLLERLKPGTMLIELDDDEEATSIAASVMRKLWKPVPHEHNFPTIERWSLGMKRLRDEFDGGTGPFPAALVEKAEKLFDDLIASMGEPVLLHGDLHHENILAAEREPWLAIDPKGVVGEPAYEVGALLRNPMRRVLGHPAPERLLARRIDQLAADLSLDRQRLIGWGLAQGVLSAWWSYEDHGHGWEPAIAFAEVMAKVME